jgi:hypothetical protein
VPITTVTAVLTSAISTEFHSASVRSGIAKSWAYHLRVKPCQLVLDLLGVSLKPNRIITAIGEDSQTMTSQV